MSLSPALEDREQGKFRDAGDSTQSKVAVHIESSDWEPSGGGGGSSTNTNGTFQDSDVDNTGAVTFVPPTNSVGFILLCPSTNKKNVRWSIGVTATSTVGNLYEPGRDSGYVPCAANISVFGLNTTPGQDKVSVQWIQSS